MIIMLVSGEENDRVQLTSSLEKHGISLVHYLNPVKAADNLEEISPGAVFFSGSDFPRHWKIMIKILRESQDRETCPFLLLSKKSETEEDISKALHLGVNGIVPWIEPYSDSLKQALGIIQRYKPLPFLKEDENTKNEKSKLTLVFSHPTTGNIITGIVIRRQGDHLMFQPSSRDQGLHLEKDQLLEDVSIQQGEEIKTVDLRILQNTGNILAQLILDKDQNSQDFRQFIDQGIS